MSIKDKLQIILITYNREKHVENTLSQFMSEDSPVKNFEFIVLDNNSTDNTEEIVRTWQEKFPNIKYKKNKYNLGISGNIFRAMEIAAKDYVWIIGDDDKYDFSNWNEVENAINNNEKIICLARYIIPNEYKNDKAYQLFQLTFITGGIYNTNLFNDTVIRNSIDNIYTLFPHLVPVVQFINDGGNIYVVENAIADNGMDLENTDCSYTRGCKNDNLYIRTKTMCWIVGYCNILSQLKDIELKYKAIDTAIVYKDIYGSFNNFYNHMKTYLSKENFMQFMDVYLNVSPIHQEKMKNIYKINYNKEYNCNLIELTTKDCFKYLWTRLIRLLYSMEKTENRRYLTILGIKIKTRRGINEK